MALSVEAQKHVEAIQSKISRANKHISDFRLAASGFMKANPYGILVERDQNTRKRIYTVTKVTPIAPQIRLIAGDAIQNLRSTLDYLAYGLVRANKTQPSTRVCFPISKCEPFTKQQQTTFARQVEGMTQDAIDAIQSIKPYKGGNDTLWQLHSLNIIDKHRLLTAAATCVSLVNPKFQTGLRDYLIKGGTPPEPTSLMRDRFPLKAGDKFSFDCEKPDMDEDEQFLLEIAFNEPGVSEGEVILSVHKQSRRCVQEVIGNLARFLY